VREAVLKHDIWSIDSDYIYRTECHVRNANVSKYMGQTLGRQDGHAAEIDRDVGSQRPGSMMVVENNILFASR